MEVLQRTAPQQDRADRDPASELPAESNGSRSPRGETGAGPPTQLRFASKPASRLTSTPSKVAASTVVATLSIVAVPLVRVAPVWLRSLMIRLAVVLVALLGVGTAGLVLGAAPAPAVAVVGEVGVTQLPAPPASSSERRAKRLPPITRTVDGAGC